MVKFCRMCRSSFLVFTLIIVLFSHTCNSSLVFHVRKLIAGVPNNSSAASQIAPSGSSVMSNTSTMKAEESRIDNQTNSNRTLPNDSKGSNENEKGDKNVTGTNPLASKEDDNIVDRGNGTLGNNGSCNGSLTSCRDQEMIACIEASSGAGSKGMFLVVQNEGGVTLKINVNFPSYLTNNLPAFEVLKHETRRIDISSAVGKSTELIVDSGKANCTLHLVGSVSVDKLIQQLSFYSKQVTPIYVVYASFLLVLLFGGILVCCKLRKMNKQNGIIPYQELEMGLPQSVSAVNDDDATEGWDHGWDDDDDDWGEDSIVKSHAGQQITSVSVDGLISRSSKKDGWDD